MNYIFDLAGVIINLDLERDTKALSSFIPNIFPWSVMAIPFIPSATALSTSLLTDACPSSME